MLGCQPSTLTQRSIHHQKSSSDSPFQANTEKPARDDTGVHYDRKAGKNTKEIWKIFTSLGQSGCYLVLSGVDVTGSPPALSTQSREGLHQHLQHTYKQTLDHALLKHTCQSALKNKLYFWKHPHKYSMTVKKFPNGPNNVPKSVGVGLGCWNYSVI